jgi:hypothetical protein
MLDVVAPKKQLELTLMEFPLEQGGSVYQSQTH